MSENFVFSSFQKPNRVTKNAALCVEERHALTVTNGGRFSIFSSCKNKLWHFFIVCTSLDK